MICQVLQHFKLKAHGLAAVEKIADGIVLCDNLQRPILLDHLKVCEPFIWSKLFYIRKPGLPLMCAGSQE